MLTWINKQFEYTNEISDLIINTRLTDLRCKHVCSLESVQAQQVYTETLKTGYDCRWGSVSGNTDCLHHLNNILRQERDNYNHALRIVITNDSTTNKRYIWTDNLHSTIKYIREKGLKTKLIDVPFYVIDLTTTMITVIDVNNSVRQSLKDIQGAIRSAVNRVRRSTFNLMALNYTVEDFLKDNMILLQNKNIADMRKEGE